MIRFPSGEDDNKVLPEEQRFYYLRLMAKPSEGKHEPIKTKFVRWAPPCTQQNSVEADQDLEVHSSCYRSFHYDIGIRAA
ncbi:unnamed protein product [Gongylonema pulchrum]|uniref:Uncharacterized protein n=1 Tax=Gongylonema pulchrum TaxID=637853 RepID=A0A183DH56_9BILA|nr:unnamed protein product [Gongylonema pulchrum]